MTTPLARTPATPILCCLLLLFAAGCMSPSERRPGLRLSGEVVATPTDWSFSDAYREIAVEVHTPYLLRHSVTVWCASLDGALYLGARNPESKSWPGWTDRNPEVRARIGDRVYELRLEPIDAEDQLARIRAAYAAKYQLPTAGGNAGSGPPMRYWRAVARD